MHAACNLTRAVKPGDRGLAISVYLEAAILVVKRRIHEHRFFAYINAVPLKLYILSRQFLSDRSFAVKSLYHWRIKPYPNPSNRGCYSFSLFKTLSDYT